MLLKSAVIMVFDLSDFTWLFFVLSESFLTTLFSASVSWCYVLEWVFFNSLQQAPGTLYPFGKSCLSAPGIFLYNLFLSILSTKNLVGWLSHFLIFSLIVSSLSVLALLSGKFLWLCLPTYVWNVSFQWCVSFLRALFHSVLFSLYGAACSFFHG